MFTTFIFDVGGTLIEVDDNRYGPLLKSEVFHKNLLKFEKGSIGPIKFTTEISKELSLPTAAIIDYLMRPLTGKFIDGMEQVLFWAHHKFKVILLSNTNIMHWAYFSQYVRNYDDRVLSFDVGFIKPNQYIYNLAADLTSGKVVYFDDKEENLEYPTSNLGWECHKFLSAKHCWEIIKQVELLAPDS